MSDLISRCVLFNELATVQTLAEAYAKIQGMPTVDRWIPCSERLPENKQRVLVQMTNGHIDIISFSAVGITSHLVAWMPLPKPWEGEG